MTERPLSDYLPSDSELSEDMHEAPDVRLLPSLLKPILRPDHFSTDEYNEPPCA